MSASTTKKITVADLLRTPGALTPAFMSNPYKFSVYRAAALNTVTSTPTAIPFDTKSFDTGTNIDVVTNKGRFTTPISGFYQINASYAATVTANSNLNVITIFKNGASLWQGNRIINNGTANIISPHVSALIQLTAGDYIEIYSENDGTYAMAVGASLVHFSGFLVSAT